MMLNAHGISYNMYVGLGRLDPNTQNVMVLIFFVFYFPLECILMNFLAGLSLNYPLILFGIDQTSTE